MLTIPSLSKLLILIAVVAAVWYGFKILGRLDQLRKAEARLARKAAAGKPKRAGVEDMAKCRACGAYVTAGTASCGRTDCPF